MSSFDWKKNIEDSIKDRLIITGTATGIFLASLDAMDIMKLAGGICGGVLVKYYAVYKKWINEWYKNFMAPGGYKITTYFSVVRIPLGSLTAKWATASLKLNI